MKVAMLSPIAWRTPPRHYGPWELIVSLITEELIKNGLDVTLFATSDSITDAKLNSVIKKGYEEDKDADAKVNEVLHLSHFFENAEKFDIIHNHYDFFPLTYSSFIKTPIVTTIHGFSSKKIIPVYEKYNKTTHYVSISYADRSSKLQYFENVYHGIDKDQFTYVDKPKDYLVFMGRIHHDKGPLEAIRIARMAKKKLIMAGIIQDLNYYETKIKPELQNSDIEYIGPVDPKKRDSLLSNATALLHPINFNEPFGLSVIESMATGTPVIAFNRGSMSELIQDGISGFLVQNEKEAVDRINRIDSIERSHCRRIVEEKFTKEKMAKNYIHVYEKILRKGKK